MPQPWTVTESAVPSQATHHLHDERTTLLRRPHSKQPWTVADSLNGCPSPVWLGRVIDKSRQRHKDTKTDINLMQIWTCNRLNLQGLMSRHLAWGLIHKSRQRTHTERTMTQPWTVTVSLNGCPSPAWLGRVIDKLRQRHIDRWKRGAEMDM